MSQRSVSSVKGMHRGRQKKGSAAAIAAERQRRWRQQERKQRGEIWIGFVSFAGRRSNVNRNRVRGRFGFCRGAGNDGQLDGVLEKIRRAKRGTTLRIGCHGFGLHQDMGALGWQDRDGDLWSSLMPQDKPRFSAIRNLAKW